MSSLLTPHQWKQLIVVLLLVDALVLGLGFWWWRLEQAKQAKAKAAVQGVVAPLPASLTLERSDEGPPLRLGQLLGKPVVLVFYPMDFTPGCTIQLCGLRDQYPRFQALGVPVFGVNPGNKASHRRFAAAHKLPFPLLVDKHRELGKALGVGETLGVSHRVVLVLNAEGYVAYREEGMSSAATLLAQVQQLLPKP